MKTGFLIEILVGIAAVLLFLFLYDVVIKRRGVVESVKARLSGLFTNGFVYGIISFGLTLLIFYLLYMLIFK